MSASAHALRWWRRAAIRPRVWLTTSLPFVRSLVRRDRPAGEPPLAAEPRLEPPADAAEAASRPTALTPEALPPGDPLFDEALRHVGEQRWGRAQQALEQMVREGRKDNALPYLADVRAVRRCLRQLARRPRDPALHLELGRLYFVLELGDAALAALSYAVTLDPNLAEGHSFLAMEYLFRGDEESAQLACTRARQLNPSLPTFERLQLLLADNDRQRRAG